MKRTLLAALLVALVAVLVPSFAAADPGSAVQADLTQLSTDVQAAHDALVADLGAVTTAAQAGDKAGAIAAIRRPARTPRRSCRPSRRIALSSAPIVKLAKAANVTGLQAEVKTAVQANRALIKEIRQARRRGSHKRSESLRHSKS